MHKNGKGDVTLLHGSQGGNVDLCQVHRDLTA